MWAVLLLIATYTSLVSAFWRLPCAQPLVVQRADPIVTPGQVSHHVHTIMGSSGFGFDMDYRQASAGACSTCKVKGDMSNYWTPTLYYRAKDGTFTSVKQSGGMLVYYLQRKSKGEELLAFPPGFRMIAGNPFLRNFTGSIPQQAVSWVCLDDKNPGETPHIPNHNCKSGLRSQVFFPSCWDGKNLDSHDHKSHMAYPSVYNAGSCPPDYPKRFVSIFYEIIWDVNEFKDRWYGKDHPFVLSTGDPTGYGHHGDFLNGWDQRLLQRAVNECTNESGKVEDCHLFSFNSDDEMKQCKHPPSVDEPVHGILRALPGCNPVQHGPDQAFPQIGCGAVNRISGPKQYFTDLTTSGWEYAGCATDSLKMRTLPKRYSSKSMTPTECVEKCSGSGYIYAGLEYGQECYCGNAVPLERAPKAGFLGNCNMPCAGDESQFCGGPRTLSLYRRCSGRNCANNVFTVPGLPAGLSVVIKQPGQSPDLTLKAPPKAVQVSATPKAPVQEVFKSKPKETGKLQSQKAPASQQRASSKAQQMHNSWSYHGCFINDFHQSHLEPATNLHRSTVSQSSCISYCNSRGQYIAGLSNGDQCFCGSALPFFPRRMSDNDCRVPCRGNARESCGSSGRMALFRAYSVPVRSVRQSKLRQHRPHRNRHHK